MYGAGLRAVSGLAELLKTHSKQIFEDLAAIALRENKGLAKHEVVASITGRITNVIEGITFGVIKETGNVTGSRRLAVTMDHVIKNDNNVFYDVIGISTKLGHYTDYPEKDIQKLWKDVHGSLFARSLIRDILWLDFHLYKRDYRIVQKVCALTKITVPRHKFLGQSTKV